MNVKPLTIKLSALIAATAVGMTALTLAGCVGDRKMRADASGGGARQSAQTAERTPVSDEDKMKEALLAIQSYQSAYLASRRRVIAHEVGCADLTPPLRADLCADYCQPRDGGVLSDWFEYRLPDNESQLKVTAKVDIGPFAAGQVIYTTYHPDNAVFVNTSTDPEAVNKLLPGFINGDDKLRAEANRLVNFYMTNSNTKHISRAERENENISKRMMFEEEAARREELSEVDAGSFTDPRDGKTYRTVKIGGQTWMAENLNYRTERGSRCFDGVNCDRYGRIYAWDTAMVACPAGWRLPSNADWEELMTAVGGVKVCNQEEDDDDDDDNNNRCYWKGAGDKLKARVGWGGNWYRGLFGLPMAPGIGGYGFSALPTGDTHPCACGTSGIWWSSTPGDRQDQSEEHERSAWAWRMEDGSSDVTAVGNRVFFDYWHKGYVKHSVRCVRE